MKTLKQLLDEKGLTQEKFEAMTAHEKAAIFNELNNINATAFKALEADVNSTKELIEAAKSELRGVQDEQWKSLNDLLKEQGLAIIKLTEAEKVESGFTLADQVRKSLYANKEKLTRLKEGGKSEVTESGFDFEVKVAGNMTIVGNVSGGNVPVEDRIEGLNIIPSRRIRLLDVMAKRSTQSQVVSWAYQANKDGAAGQTAEGAAKNQIDFDIVVDSETVKKTTAFIKVSTEMMDDIDWIVTEIENELVRNLLKAVELQAYSGDGTGQNHNGVRTQATAFSAGSFALAIDNANEVDVLTVAANQIRIAMEGDAEPNYIFMHPTDVTRLRMIKVSATDKRYVERLVDVAGMLMLDGIPIIQTTLVTAGEYLIGDFDLSLLVTRSSMRIDVGTDADDFTKNLRTILAEWRGLTLIKNNHTAAFVKGVFATDKAALETA